MLIRVFLGWLRGERGHCGMVAIPTLADEDAKRPSRERENLVAERTRISNRLKSALARLGIRGFKPTLRKAPQRLAALRTLEGVPIPPNTVAEMQRDMARLAVLREQIEEIERARLQALQQAANSGPHAMVRLLAHRRCRHRDGRHAGARGTDAEPAGPPGRGALRRLDRHARRKRIQATREGAG